jgi:polyisoprenoid-binding protein YceI
MLGPIRRHWVWSVTGAVAVIVVLAVGGPFVYIHFISGKAPAKLTLPSARSAEPGSPASTPLTGSWNAGSGSQAGYRVNEILFGQKNTAVGRTSSVAGHITISGTTVTAGTFTVGMASVKSDQSTRDVQFRGRIMDVAQYPDSTFTLSRPISLAPLPAPGVDKSYPAEGDLSLRGQTRPVTVTVQAARSSSTIQVSGSIPVTFARWNIPNPSFGPITTQDHGELEFLLAFRRS